MRMQWELDHAQDIIIQLEIVPEDIQQQDLVSIEEEGQDVINYIKEEGYTVIPVYTGRMGSPVYDILFHAYKIIHGNEELLAAMFSSLTAMLTLLNKREKKTKNDQSLFSSASVPIEITFQTKNGPLTIKAVDTEAAVKMLEQLQASHLQVQMIAPDSKPKVKFIVPIQKWFRSS